MPPPAKKQKRPIVLSSDSEYNEDEEIVPSRVTGHERASPTKPTTVIKSTRTAALPTRSRPRVSSTKAKTKASKKSLATSSPKKSAGNTKSTSTSATLYKFFNTATLGRRASSIARTTPSTTGAEVEEDDLIQDDFLDEEISDLAHCQRHESNGRDSHKRPRLLPSSSESITYKETHPSASQRFLNPRKTLQSNVVHASVVLDTRPWAEKYAPANLEELAVHKKKVSDVRRWLENVWEGRDSKRLLILKGPSGAGKTTTISLLSAVLRFEIMEWKNPMTSEFSSDGFLSMARQFEDFLSRSGTFSGLALQGTTKLHLSQSLDEPRAQRKATLIEEFPNTFTRSSSATAAFRTSVLQFLACNTPPTGALFTRKHEIDESAMPLIMIISETLISSTTAVTESFTAHRLLGPDILNHPGTTMIEFNPIAPTILTKSLNLVIQKEARQSGRRRTAGPAVLSKLSEIGDVRSAIGSLEFVCLRGEADNDWGGRVATRGKKGAKNSPALTEMEQESIEVVTQREATLGIFHAVGKVVYNKRGDIPSSDPYVDPPVQPPDHLSQYARPKVSQVSLDDLIDETGTDISTFIAALHENYALSCDGDDAMNAINGCLDALSDSDVLSCNNSGGRGARNNSGHDYPQGSSQESLRRNEICFQVAVRGLLFALPYPVKRRPLTTGAGAGERSGRKTDIFKMFYPTSLRLWKQTEEIEALIARWIDTSMMLAIDPLERASVQPRGVEIWANKATALKTQAETPRNFDKTVPVSPFATGASARTEMILERLPYIVRIEHHGNNHQRLRELEQMTKFYGINTPDDSTLDEYDEIGTTSKTIATTDRLSKTSPTRYGKYGSDGSISGSSRSDSNSTHTIGHAVEKLDLSDDEIEDD